MSAPPRPSSSLTSVENILFNHESFNREQLEQYKKYIEEHVRYDTHRVERALRCGEQIERLIERLSSPPQNLMDLINQMEEINTAQADTLKNLRTRDENCQIFLTNYETNAAPRGRTANVEGTFTILGSVRKGTREQYEVKLYKHGSNEKGSFWCNCPDHKFNSKKKDIVCKHICFLVCKVGKIFDTEYFKSKQLSEEQFQTVLNKAANLNDLLKDTSICKPPVHVTRELFTNRTRHIDAEDMCPICYECLAPPTSGDGDSSDLNAHMILTCPSCTNYVHKECMDVWLERKTTCVYCRSDVWKTYKEVLAVSGLVSS